MGVSLRRLAERSSINARCIVGRAGGWRACSCFGATLHPSTAAGPGDYSGSLALQASRIFQSVRRYSTWRPAAADMMMIRYPSDEQEYSSFPDPFPSDNLIDDRELRAHATSTIIGSRSARCEARESQVAAREAS